MIGKVSVLRTVGFSGSIDGQPDSPPVFGQPCSGTGGYGDIAPGGVVIITDPAGAAIATTQLGGGVTTSAVRKTESERVQREDLIDAIYELRIALVAGDPVRSAQLNLDRANVRLADLDNPDPVPPFEGHPFWAQWCDVSFTTPPLPDHPTYGVSITQRGTSTVTRQEVLSGQVSLIIG